MATMLYDGLVQRCWGQLSEELGYDEVGKTRYRKLVRIAALLHDVGHAPFSHAAEELAPARLDGTRYRHEDYSAAIIRKEFKEVIEKHKANNNYNFSIGEVVGLIEGGVAAGRAALWQDLISGQLDADRMDYLLRDSYHAGVEYGRYDWRRIVSTVEFVPDVETNTPRFGVSEAGRHAAEGLIIARYMMFNQVYFHKTRVILDYHLRKTMAAMLPNGLFPAPTESGIKDYLAWDDWRVLGKLSAGEGGEHGGRLTRRDFYRQVWETPEFPSVEDEDKLAEVENILGDLLAARCEASNSWYRIGETDLPVAADHRGGKNRPLSQSSTIVGNMQPTRRTRLYVKPEDREKARKILEQEIGGEKS